MTSGGPAATLLAEAPKWTDVAQAWGAISAAILTLLALVVALGLARVDRKRSAADLQAEVRRGEEALRRQRSEAAAEQLRVFRITTLLEVIKLYSEYVTADHLTRARLTTSLRALLYCLPEDVATLVRYDTATIVTAKSQAAAETWMAKRGARLQRPVPPDLIAQEFEADIRRFLPGAPA